MLQIAPVPLTQVYAALDGRQYEVSGEAGRIVQRLQEVDPTLRVVFNEGGGFFAIQQVVDDKSGEAVAVEGDATQRKCVMRVHPDDWDGRVVTEFEFRAHEIRHGVSAAKRLDALDARQKADAEYEFDQEARAGAAPLFRAFQRGIVGANPRAFIASGLSR